MSRVTIIVLIALVGGIGAVSAVWPDSEAPPKPAPFGGRASDQGYPWIVSWERVELPTVYVSATGGLEMMGPKFVRPTALATADFDEDGMPDLVSGYAGSVGGFLSIHRGNEGFLWPYKKPLARAPFWPEARVFDLPEPPDLLGAGDFDADGHADVIAAARGGRTLYWLRGDGRGGVHERHERELPGSVTALAVGEINRADGLMDIVVGITGPEGPRVLIFEGPNGALRHEPEEISLPEEATALALGPLDEHDESDLAIAAGHHLLVVHGRDRYSPSERRALRVDQQVLPFQIVALALGDFRAEGEHDMEIAVLGEDGALRVLARDPLLQTHGMSASWTMIADHPIEGFSTNISSRSSGRSLLLVRARVSSAPTDDVLVLDPESRRAHVLTSVASVVTSTQEFGEDSFSLSVRALPLAEGAIVAVLPMRLNADALTDLVVLREGAAEPEGLITIASLTFTVNTTNDVDDGSCNIIHCSLREAILAANSNPGPDLIHFNIPGSGPHTILIFPAMNGPLPTITDAVTIDGYTQPGATPNSNPAPQGLNAQLKIVIRRSGGTASGLTISASNVVVRGVVINNFNQNGILITGSNVIIEGNFIGTDAGGTNDQGNTQDGIRISGANNRVGGTLPAARNLISGNNSDGIEITGSGATGNLVQGNLIGTTASGSSGLANSSDGIQIFNSASNNTIGGTAAGAGNVIAFNGADGVFVSSGTGNRIQRNSIFSNGGLGIDLGANGVTSNDPGDPDSGANRLQNFPVLQSIVVSGGNTTILGSIDSATSNSTYPITIEFFSNSSCDPSGHGEGETFLGAISVSGPGSFIATFAVSLPLNSVVTATATDSAGNTSEFSACARVNGRIVISKTAQGGDGTFSYTVASGATVMASPSITTSSGSGSVTLLVTPGVYAVTEGTLPVGWDFVGVVCVDPDGGTTTSGATANVDVDPGETVTCTYTNRKRGRVVVQKSAVGGDGTFSYTGGLGAFTITTSGGTGSQVFDNVVPGVYAVTEGTPPAGWDFVGVVCGDPDGGTTTSGATANIDVDPGETVTCTYTNRKRGRVVVQKSAVGGDETFSYTGGLGSFTITTSGGTGSQVFNNVVPGVYAVTEGAPPAGWDFVGVVCGDPDGGTTTSGATANIDVDPGETVTCTYTNRKRGRVVVQKSAVGGDETFSYTGGLGSFTITTSGGTGSQVFDNVVPGVYAVTEGTPPAGWDFVGVVCGDPDGGTTTSGATANVDVDPGETVTCTYTNRKRGRVVVQKSAVGGDETFSYTGGLGAFTITTSGGTGSQVFDNVVPGVYAVTEGTPPAGWDFVGVVCGDPDGGTTTSGATANIDVDPGEEVRCTYMNRKRGRIAVRKITDPNPDPTDTRFAFTGAATGSIRNGEALSVDNLVPGTYRVTEVVPDQFELISISCDDGASPQPSFGDVSAATATFRLDPGEVVTCTFVNRLKRANLTAVAFVLRLETGGEVARQSVRTLAEGTRGVIVVDAIQDRVRVFLNSRDGTLRPGQVVSVGREPVAAVAGDLDGDGMTDVITADFQSRTLTILRGAGDGTFQRRRTLSLPAKPAALTAGDFDRDGRLDVVVAYVEEDEIQVFRGEGDFRFTPGRRISVGKRPVALAAADFNDDRILDVAVVASASDTVSIWLGRGDGTFVLGGDVVVGREPVAIAVGDFDGDGKVDLVTADFRASTLSVVSNEGTTEGGRRLRLRVMATVPTAEGPTAVVSGRFFDERMGIASAGSVAGQVWVHTRESTGRWSTWQRMNVQVAAIAMVTEDVDGDERLDLIVLDATGSVIQVWLNSEGEVFRRRQ
jgi:CSLREA domain-containing protein